MNPHLDFVNKALKRKHFPQPCPCEQIAVQTQLHHRRCTEALLSFGDHLQHHRCWSYPPKYLHYGLQHSWSATCKWLIGAISLIWTQTRRKMDLVIVAQHRQHHQYSTRQLFQQILRWSQIITSCLCLLCIIPTSASPELQNRVHNFATWYSVSYHIIWWLMAWKL